MPRRNTPQRNPSQRRRSGRRSGTDDARPLGNQLGHHSLGLSAPRAEHGSPKGWGDDEFLVRDVPGSAATKDYRCPGCDQIIVQGSAHVVAWPSRPGGAEDRRHWHRGCWNRRATRSVTRKWS
ncbi:ATP/GTP-binding protein [Lolliginicoccus lacisalsi]|uniref:ATP/GTP-binding protein n=1 Tax=Lolliginicoccus lacisalsi TaxID=2742202 RepID=UPI001CDC0EAC|nr:ATP/GTP-binding protein [Lolliginicoccus lacisalsi]